MFDRRNFVRLLSLGGLLGGTTAASASVAKPPLQKDGGVIIFYVNVGTLPAFKAESIVRKMRDQMPPPPHGWQRYFLPVRPPQEAKVQVFFNENHRGEAEKIALELVNAHVLPNS